jgi:hypothetical protein
MKRFMTLIAGAILAMTAFSTAAYAETDLSDRNGGLTKIVYLSNVPAQSGSVVGFRVQNIGWFVEESSAEYATVNAIVVPAEFNPKEAEDVATYLRSVGLTNFAVEARENFRPSSNTIGNGVPACRPAAFRCAPQG